jgi:hypothetical protein
MRKKENATTVAQQSEVKQVELFASEVTSEAQEVKKESKPKRRGKGADFADKMWARFDEIEGEQETVNAVIPEPKKEAKKETNKAAKVKKSGAGLQIVDYSEKAFAVVGDTKKIKAKLMILGGKFNPKLSCGAGWIFSKKRMQSVRLALAI